MDNSHQEKYLRLLQQSFLLQGCSEEAARQLLAGDIRIIDFVKGQCLFNNGHFPLAKDSTEGCLGLFVRGRGAAYSGGNAILRSFGPGDVFGAAALFAPGAETISRIMAESPGQALLLPFGDIQKLLHQEGQAAENYIRFLAQRVAFLNRKIAAFTGGEAQQRLAAYIVANCHKDEAGRPICQVNPSKLGPALNISRSSLYRALAQLTEEGLLHREGKNIIVDNLQQLTEQQLNTP